MSHIKDPFLVIGDVRGTFELSSCYNVTIDCRSSEMVATITTNKIFSGKIYAKDNPNSCVVDVENAIEFNIKMGYNDIGESKFYFKISPLGGFKALTLNSV